ncbi:TonB-dependent receptor [Sphingomonas immobilis]|uniref:TonB-dependent receptor n=1 Tax=Sphingomonas immobilis TaxID=3063997 RepID=A0ABT8ZXE0_9SPHN|nr:TonB-dependent receptor [Sphingomonas sp. CA1-15]MDO7842230.1 TonB-dependent receptor [Sphingomonas sp. CA1-15]
MKVNARFACGTAVRRAPLHKIMVSLGALAAGLISTAATAQSAAAPQDAPAQEQTLEDIVVTARKIAENLQDVPVAITAYSGATLTQQGATKVSDVARTTPSLTVRESPSNPSGISITLRGQVQTDILATLDPSVGTYVDGVYWSRAYGLNQDLLDLRSVQVLKGPQGTLFGRNTTGGAMLFETNDPDFNGISGSVQGTYGRFNERVATGVINIPLIADKLAIRAAVQRNLRDGWMVDRITGDKYNDRNNWAARGKLLYRATDNLSFLFSGEYFKQETHASGRQLLYLIPSGLTPPSAAGDASLQAAGVAAAATLTGAGATVPAGISPFSYPAIGSSGATQAGGNLRSYYVGLNPNSTELSHGVAGNINLPDASPRTFVETQTYNGTINFDTFFGNIKFIGGWRNVKTTSRLDLDGSVAPIHTTTGDQNLTQYSGELQATGKMFDNAVDFAGGLFYFHESGFDTSSSITLPSFNAATTLFSGQLDNDSMGMYGQASWHMTDRLTFTGGLRYSVDDKGLTTRNQTFNRTTGVFACQIPTATVATQCALPVRNAFEGVAYLASLDYKLTDDVLVYLKTSRGFRSGGQNLRANSVTTAIPFRPEIAYAHEAGIKSELFERHLRVNLAGYYSNVYDIQRTTLIGLPNGTTQTVLSNAGGIRIFGFEGEVTAQLPGGFQLGGTGTYTNAKYTGFQELPSRTNLTGSRLTERVEGVPEWSFSVSGAYAHTFDFGKLNLRADYSWNSKINLQPYTPFLGDPQGVTIDPNTPGRTIAQNVVDATTSPAQGVLSARASISIMDDKLEFAVYGRNLTDNRAIVQALYVGGIGYVSGVPREPATYGGTITFRFGQ